MARKPRLTIPGYYHIISRGVAQQPILQLTILLTSDIKFNGLVDTNTDLVITNNQAPFITLE